MRNFHKQGIAAKDIGVSMGVEVQEGLHNSWSRSVSSLGDRHLNGGDIESTSLSGREFEDGLPALLARGVLRAFRFSGRGIILNLHLLPLERSLKVATSLKLGGERLNRSMEGSKGGFVRLLGLLLSFGLSDKVALPRGH